MTRRTSFEMLARGPFAPERVVVDYRPGSGGGVPPRLDEAVAREWEERVARAAREGVALTNGALLRLQELREGDAGLYLTLGDTRYAHFLATNWDRTRRAELDWEELSNPLGTSALVVTADGWCVLGLRGDSVMHHRGHLHTIGGMFEAVDVRDGGVDAGESMLREVYEELGIAPDDVARLVCTGVMRDLETRQPELLFDVELAITAERLESCWASAESREEHARLVYTRDEPAALAALAAGDDPLAPQAEAVLALRAGAP